MAIGSQVLILTQNMTSYKPIYQKFNTLLFLVLISNFSFSQNPEYKGLLWKIEGNGLTKPSYLMGSMHVSNRVAFHLSDSFFKAMEGVDMVALEINADKWMETMSSNPFVAKKMVNSFLSMSNTNDDNGFYKALFNLAEPKNRIIGENLGRESGAINSLLYRTGASNAEFQEDTYLDMFIYQLGKKLGKEVTGLENLEYTYRLTDMAYKPEEDWEKRKEEKIKSDLRQFQLNRLLKNRPISEVMEDAYRDGDLDLLDSISRLSDYSTKSHYLIIGHRNKIMAAAIDSILKTKSLFAAVGAAHLANTYGVINLLREMGYTLSPISDHKSDFGKDYKDRIDTTFIHLNPTVFKSFDETYEVKVPQTLYEFPEYQGVQLAAFPDMANGATYTVTRIHTYTPLTGLTSAQYMAKIDSLFFENIPGKIDSKKVIEVSGYPGYEIVNTTKKGDKQRSKIIITPLEIMIFKVSGKKRFADRKEALDFINSVVITKIHHQNFDYTPKNNAYTVKLNGLRLYESDDNAFKLGFWSKNVQSINSDGEYFAVLNRSNFDLNYIEEDSFELAQFANFFVQSHGYKNELSFSTDSFKKYGAREIIATHDSRVDDTLFLKLIYQGKHTFMLVAKSKQASAKSFFNSFSFGDYEYEYEPKLQLDSSLFYSVSSVAELTNQYKDQYRWNENEDLSHQSQEKTSYFYYPPTDELIWVFMEKYHRFHFEKSIDSIWNDCKKDLTQQGDFHVISEKKSDNTYLLHVGDTNSMRCIVGKFILKGGVKYALKTEIDRNMPLSGFVASFMESFTPWDTLIERSPLEKKAALLLEDIASKDSIKRKQAVSSLNILDIADDEVPIVIAGVKKWSVGEDNVKIRSALLHKIGQAKHPQAIPFLESYFKQVEDTSVLQIPILSAIANRKTKKATKQFLNLLLIEPPLSKDNFTINRIFKPFDDSLRLAKELYPGLLKLSALPEYKYRSYRILANLVDSQYIKPRNYRKYVKAIVFESNNELKRQKSAEAEKDEKFYRESNRYEIYNYNNSLYHYATILLPFSKRGGARKFYRRIETLNSPGLQMDLAALMIRNNKQTNAALIRSFAENENHRYKFYSILQQQNTLSAFPETFADQALLSVSAFGSFANLNLYRDSVELVETIETKIEGLDSRVYFYRVKKKNANLWSMGYITVQTKDNGAITFNQDLFQGSMDYSEFEEDDIQIQRQIRELEMKKRRRYEVLDEPEFEELRNSLGGGLYF